MLPTLHGVQPDPRHVRTKEIVEEWTVSTWEFPQKLDESAFDPLKWSVRGGGGEPEASASVSLFRLGSADLPNQTLPPGPCIRHFLMSF